MDRKGKGKKERGDLLSSFVFFYHYCEKRTPRRKAVAAPAELLLLLLLLCFCYFLLLGVVGRSFCLSFPTYLHEPPRLFSLLHSPLSNGPPRPPRRHSFGVGLVLLSLFPIRHASGTVRHGLHAPDRQRGSAGSVPREAVLRRGRYRQLRSSVSGRSSFFCGASSR